MRARELAIRRGAAAFAEIGIARARSRGAEAQNSQPAQNSRFSGRELAIRERSDELASLPNAISIAGYACTVAWLMGASPWFAVLGVVADEVDGRVARAHGRATKFGSSLDWAIDITLTGAMAVRSGTVWSLPFVTVAQVAMREDGYRPTFGSARALQTAFVLYRTRFRPLEPVRPAW